MAKKRIFALIFALLALIGVCFTSACNQKPQEEAEYLTERQQTFVDAVQAIEPPITTESGGAINAAYVAYAFLDEYERDSKTVARNKETLDGYQREYAALEGAEQPGTTENRQQVLIGEFLAAVEALPALADLTVDDRTAIDRAYVAYRKLNEESQADSAVVSAYQTLESANRRVTTLEDAANQAAWQRMADEFIGAVADIDEVTLDSVGELEDLLYAWEHFPDGVKNIGGMSNAKALLDEKYAAYQKLRDESDVKEFISAVQAIGEVTLESEGAIRKAENLYKYMSDSARSTESVVAAYATLTAARAAFDELFAIAEAKKIAHFIEAANNVPTDLENVNISWYDVLYAAQEAYFALSYESTRLPEVEAAFDRWDAAQSAFDKLGFKQIPMVDPNLLYSGDVPPHIVVQMEENMLAPVREFYNVNTMAELAQQANCYLNVYVDGVYVAKGELNLAGLGHIIMNSEILSILKKLSAEHAEIVSGANFSFSIHFEDKQARHIPSNKTKISESKNTYIW